MKTIADCMRNIRLVSTKYNCDVMIVETGFLVDEERPYVMVQGREQFAELLRRARTETAGKCKGVFYWEPTCKPSQYKLGAFHEDGRPTDIMRAIYNDALRTGNMELAKGYDRKIVSIETTHGTVTVELYNETPIHRDNFLRLARSGALEGTLFHRVINDFMIQGGDPESKTASQTSKNNPAPQLGNSDVPTDDGQVSIPAEIRYPQFFHKRGALAAARESDDTNPEKCSSASQFYIVWGKWPTTVGKKPYEPLHEYYEMDPDTRKPKSYFKAWDKNARPMPETQPGTPWLDGGYTVFGEVINGLDVVGNIQQMPTDPFDRPLEDVRIIKVKCEN